MSSKLKEIRCIDVLLKDHLKNPKTKIIKQDIKYLTAPGENYGSLILAVDVTVQEDDIYPPKILNLVAKRLPPSQLLCDMFNIQKTFKVEMAMYMEVIPTLTKFQEDFGVKEDVKISHLFAKCFGGRINLNTDSDYVDEDAVLLLENLKSSGHEMGDRLIGFDLDHTYQILKDLANFHAVPIAMKLLRPEEFKKLLNYITGAKFENLFGQDLTQKEVDETVGILRETPACHPYLKNVGTALYNSLEDLYRQAPPREPFATIVHTDLWVNNAMVLHDEKGMPIGTKLVDLQTPNYSSSVTDLIFFLFSSVTPKVLHENIDSFIKFYYNCFVERLKEFQVDLEPFCWETFNEEIKHYGIAELGHVLMMFKPILTVRGAIDDMSSWGVDDMTKSNVLTDDYKNRVTDTTLFFINHKWITE